MERQKRERRSALAVAMLIFLLIFNNDTILDIGGVLELVLQPLPRINPSGRSLLTPAHAVYRGGWDGGGCATERGAWPPGSTPCRAPRQRPRAAGFGHPGPGGARPVDGEVKAQQLRPELAVTSRDDGHVQVTSRDVRVTSYMQTTETPLSGVREQLVGTEGPGRPRG